MYIVKKGTHEQENSKRSQPETNTLTSEMGFDLGRRLRRRAFHRFRRLPNARIWTEGRASKVFVWVGREECKSHHAIPGNLPAFSKLCFTKGYCCPLHVGNWGKYPLPFQVERADQRLRVCTSFDIAILKVMQRASNCNM